MQFFNAVLPIFMSYTSSEICNYIICKIAYNTGIESAVAQMVRLRLGLGFKFILARRGAKRGVKQGMKCRV